MNPQPGIHRLAVAVRQRRAQLGYVQGDLRKHGGPGVVKVGEIEREEDVEPQPGTLAKLDTALNWPSGTAASIYFGDQPDPRLIYGKRVLVVEPEDDYVLHLDDERLDKIQSALEQALREIVDLKKERT